MRAVGNFLGRLVGMSEGAAAMKAAKGAASPPLAATVTAGNQQALLDRFLSDQTCATEMKQLLNPLQIHAMGNEVFARHRKPTKAAELWAAAAAAGHPDARYSLATYSLDRASSGGEATPHALSVSAAVEELAQLSSVGHGQAQHALALLQREGTHGVSKDAAAALRGFKDAARAGVLPAIHAAASMMLSGEGTRGGAPEVEKAIKWFRTGADGPGGGDPACHLALGILKMDSEVHKELFDPQAAFEHLQRASAAGIPQAKHNAAVALQNGIGCERNEEEAAALFAEAAKRGYLPSMVNFGVMLAKGDGVPQDRPGARAILERAAHEGDRTARELLEELGLCDD